MTGDFQLEMNEYLPLRDVVFQTLRQAILKGELKPGERLMEIQLAQKLGVSRTPVREAIRKLELEGLVLMIPRKGAEVAEITIKDLEDVLEVRAALEELAVCDACENITEEQILALKEAADNFQAALESDDLVKCAETDCRCRSSYEGHAGSDLRRKSHRTRRSTSAVQSFRCRNHRRFLCAGRYVPERLLCPYYP